MNADTNWQFAQDFMSDNEIQEILEIEADLDIDLENLEDDESEIALDESADAESDWAD
jgi:hypothetical protein